MSMDITGICFIIKLNYPHLLGGLKGLPSCLQELEVGGRKVYYTCTVQYSVLHLYCTL